MSYEREVDVQSKLKKFFKKTALINEHNQNKK